MGLKTAVDNATDPAVKSELEQEYQRKAVLLQKQNKAYNDFCEQNNFKRLQDRLQIAKWDRQQAAAARGAAQRYEKHLEISKKQDIIKQRISNGEYSLKLSRQQYLKHVDGTSQFEDYANSRRAKGQTPQSRITIPEEEVRDIITNKSGTGMPEMDRNGKVLNKEYISCDKVIGQYYSDGTWIDTDNGKIHYGKRGSHLVPIKEQK